jgi:hypothetical protein
MNCIKCGSPLIKDAVFCLKCGEHQPSNFKETEAVINEEPVIIEKKNDVGSAIILVDSAIRKFRFVKSILAIVFLVGFFIVKDFVIPTISKINYNLNINKVSKFVYDGYEFSITGKHSYEIKSGAIYIEEGDLKKNYLITIASEDEIKKETEVKEMILINRTLFCKDSIIDNTFKLIACYSKLEENNYFVIVYMSKDISDNYEKIENIVPILDSAKKV